MTTAKKVQLSEGRFTIATAPQIPVGHWLAGQGIGATELYAAAALTGVMLEKKAADATLGLDIRISDMKINGHDVATLTHGIFLHYVGGVVIENVQLYQITENAIQLELEDASHKTSVVHINKVRIDGCRKYALYFDGVVSTFVSDTEITDGSVYFRNTSSCYFSNIHQEGQYYVVGNHAVSFNLACYRITISNWLLSQDGGFKILGTASGDSFEITIANLISLGADQRLYFGEWARDITILGGEVSSTDSRGVDMNSSAKRIVIIGMMARDCYKEGFRLRGTGHKLIGCFARDNNVEEAANVAGIGISDLSESLVQGCTSKNVDGNTQKYGLSLAGTNADNDYFDNDLDDNADGAVYGAFAATEKRSRNRGYITENSGASTGTGAQQTIAHGLSFTPTRQQIALTPGSATANPYHSAAPDATNIYVTAVSGQAWYWATVGG